MRKLTCLLLGLILIGGYQSGFSQSGGQLKWLIVGSLHSFFSEQGGEVEICRRSHGPIEDGLFWPAEYGHRQSSMVNRALWLGTTNFYDTKLEQTFPHKVVGVGPRNAPADRPNQVMEVSLTLIGRFNHPAVTVDGEPATDNEIYDMPDATNPALVCDRMIINTVNTSIGITVNRKLLAFSRQDHDNYFIYDYVFKNTGIIDTLGTVVERTLSGCVFYFLYRYSFAGESFPDEYGNDQSGWSPWNATWGRNCINQVIFTDPDHPANPMHAHYAWWGPHSERPFTDLDDDWGCPDEQGDGTMAAARYAGCLTLHADISATNKTNDPDQPITTAYLGSDDQTTQYYSEYDANLMNNKYEAMTAGHQERTHAQEIELAGVAADQWGYDAGGYSQGQGFGPYTLTPADSIHIVLAEGVAGISREKNREVGGNWYKYYTGTGSPALIMPDGSPAVNATDYKKAWVQTSEDSLLKTFRNAQMNYQSGYDIPQSPPPPDEFSVTSGDLFIHLEWSDNATSWPGFNGYVIYRSKDYVKSPEAVYRKIFECNAAHVVHQYTDYDTRQGIDYYYYIQSKDNGAQNNGVPLYSSKFWTMTSVPAHSARISAMDELSGHLPFSFQLKQNYPNPFNPATTIYFTLPKASEVTLKVFDLLGKEIETIYQGQCQAGDNKINWLAKGLANGIYLYHLQAGEYFATKKMILLK